jgi:hypothetical protein
VRSQITTDDQSSTVRLSVMTHCSRSRPGSASRGELPMASDDDPLASDDELCCPFCGSPDIRVVEVGPLLGRLEFEILIVCLACDAVFTVPGRQA